MSFPCKEEVVEIENLVKQQIRIYKDSCDFGIFNSFELQKKLHNLCAKLAKAYKMQKWDTALNKGVQFFVPFEQDGHCWHGETININLFTPTYKKQKVFFSIEIFHDSTSENPFKG